MPHACLLRVDMPWHGELPCRAIDSDQHSTVSIQREECHGSEPNGTILAVMKSSPVDERHVSVVDVWIECRTLHESLCWSSAVTARRWYVACWSPTHFVTGRYLRVDCIPTVTNSPYSNLISTEARLGRQIVCISTAGGKYNASFLFHMNVFSSINKGTD